MCFAYHHTICVFPTVMLCTVMAPQRSCLFFMCIKLSADTTHHA